jgi:hypothetical protein
MKKLVSLALILGFASLALAGSHTEAPKAGKFTMADMKAEMMKCAVCKNMGTKIEAIGPMSMEVVNLDNGMAMTHVVKDASKVGVLHEANAACAKAGEACMTMTDAQAKTDLCSFCQEIRGVVKKGATISTGNTKSGCMMVMTSTDPAVQKEIMGMAEKCAMMAAMMN